jgi:hypothetical protein
MRTNTRLLRNVLFALGVGALAGCGETARLSAPEAASRLTASSQYVDVSGGTYERRSPSGTYFATYSGGQITVKDNGSTIGTVDGGWSGPELFQGTALTLHAQAAGGGCVFLRWVVSGYGNVTTNPLTVANYPLAEEIRGEFQCYV